MDWLKWFPLLLLPITDVSQQTVRRWIASGRITAHRVRPRLSRVDLDEIEAKIIHTVPTVNRQS